MTYSSRWSRLARRYKRGIIDPHCWLCHQPIDLLLPHGDRMSCTVDHVIPRVMGGEDTMDNMQLSHRSCNTRRSNQMKNDKWNIKTSIQW